MKLTTNKIAFALLTLAMAWYAFPTQAEKGAGGLRLSRPIESPYGVHFTWTGGADDATFSIYRRVEYTTQWELIATGLTGTSGWADAPGFTLDRTYEYKIQADEP